MKLVSMTEFVAERGRLMISEAHDAQINLDAPYDDNEKEEIKDWKAQYYDDIKSYADFLQRPLELSMFIVPPGKFDTSKHVLFNGFSPSEFQPGGNILVECSDQILVLNSPAINEWSCSFNLEIASNNIETLFERLRDLNISLDISDIAFRQIFKLIPY